MPAKTQKLDQDLIRLLSWFQKNQRPTPWRRNRDPYRIWISEVMLQQTTTTAVIPYFEKFVARFPDLKTLAEAPLADVLELWAGLGYYSRARNLHKAAQIISALGVFPKTAQELIELPGFGPYMSRAVASQAFNEAVGVLDGNVIRVLSRYYGRKKQWWAQKERRLLQSLSDLWVQSHNSGEMNQAMMELGATLCTPQNPQCLLCPIATQCAALKTRQQKKIPLSKPRRAKELWLWEVFPHEVNRRVAIMHYKDVPFLKNHWALPGRAVPIAEKPKHFSFRHSITHHDIYVVIRKERNPKKIRFQKWVPKAEIKKHSPLSLVQKVLNHVHN